MMMIWTNRGQYRRSEYKTEAELEAAILEVREQLFGADRLYLDVKRRIGAKGGVRNVPDGYLLDLAGARPRLYVVENELQRHDHLRHIAVQILQFSLSFESEPIAIKQILMEALDSQPEAKRACEGYATNRGFRNVDHLLEHLVFESPFTALVIIDEMPENLQNILSQKFKFGVEVLELARYENASKECVYQFEPFLADVLEDIAVAAPGDSKVALIDTTDLDTVVVPAREEGFHRVFLGEQRWHAIRIHGSMRPQIKYIAGYQIAPVSAITHVAPVKSIEPWEDTDKVVVNFAEPAKLIGPIPLVKAGKARPLQNLRYTNRRRLDGAKTLDDLWGADAAGVSD